METKKISPHIFTTLSDIAKIYEGKTSPNPPVGAILISQSGEIQATGYHQGPGKEHAERVAILEAEKKNIDLTQSTLLVSLEPCNHHGRTPPCTELIIKKKIPHVIYCERDINPDVQGHGHEALEQHGVCVDIIPYEPIRTLYTPYFNWLEHKKPWTSFKIALSLDGKYALIDQGQLRRIKLTNTEFDIFTHTMRKKHTALLTTSKTIRIDNPCMNVRSPSLEQEGRTEIVKEEKTLFILAPKLDLSPHANVFSLKNVYIFYNPSLIHARKDFASHIHLIPIDEISFPHFIEKAFSLIGGFGFYSLWIEGGGELLSYCLDHHLLNKLYMALTPHCIGPLGADLFSRLNNIDIKKNMKELSWSFYGDNALLEILYLKNL